MAIAGTTGLTCLVPRLSNDAQALWAFTSAVIHTSIGGVSDYFTDGAENGLKVGDIMFVSKSTATIGTTMHYVTVVTAGGAATVSAAILA